MCLLASLTAALVLGPAETARAQESEPRPEDDTPGGTQATKAAQSFQISTTLEGAWNENVAFRTREDPSDYEAYAVTRLAVGGRSRRGQISFSLGGSAFVYRSLAELNRADGTAALEGSHNLSRSVTARFEGNFARSHTDVLPLLIREGLQFALARADSFGGGAGLTWRMTPRTSLDMSGRYTQVDFQTRELVDTRSTNAEITLARGLGKRDSLSLGYDYQRTGQPSSASDTHSATLGWTHDFSRRLVLSLAGGASYSIEPGEARGQWFPDGRVSLTGRWRRASLSAQYARAVSPAYGLGGVTLSDIFGLAASVPLGQKWSFTVTGTHAFARSPQSLESLYTTDDLTLELSRALSRHWGFTLGGRLRRRDTPEELMAKRGSIAIYYTTQDRP